MFSSTGAKFCSSSSSKYPIYTNVMISSVFLIISPGEALIFFPGRYVRPGFPNLGPLGACEGITYHECSSSKSGFYHSFLATIVVQLPGISRHQVKAPLSILASIKYIVVDTLQKKK